MMDYYLAIKRNKVLIHQKKKKKKKNLKNILSERSQTQKRRYEIPAQVNRPVVIEIKK